MRHEPKLVDLADLQWRGHLRLFWTFLAVLAASVAGMFVSIYRPDWLTSFFAFVAAASFLGAGLSVNIILEFRREQRLWFMNRPGRRRS